MPRLSSEQGIVQATRVSDYVFTSPRPYLTFPILFVLSLLLGLVVSFSYDVVVLLTVAVSLFFIPAAAGSLLAVPAARAAGGIIYLRRSTLMALISLGLIIPFALVWRGVLEPHFHTRLSDVLLFCYGLVFWLWHLVLLTTSNSSHARTAPVSLLLPVIGIVMVAIFLPPFGIRELLLVVGFLGVFFLSGAAFRKMAESPLKRNFGASGMDLVRNMLSHWTEGGDAGKSEMEKFFSTFAVHFRAEVGVIGFRNREGKLRSMWVVPSVHPGPFGTLGGSDLPGKLKKEIDAPNLMVFHGAATHDQNPASDEDVKKIGGAVNGMKKEMTFATGAGPMTRLKGAKVNLCLQMLGDAVMAVHTSAPDPTDDVDHPVGKMVEDAFRRHGAKHPFFCDAHNCLERGGGAVHYGTREAEELLRLALEGAAQYKKPEGALRAGFAQTGGFDKTKDGLGPAGIQVAVLETGGRKSAYILLDGNNMEKGLRETILEAVKGTFDEAEVLTTDNHCVHATMGGYNPVGARYPKDKLAQLAKDTVRKALDGMEEVETGAASTKVDIRVFGHNNTARLTTAINSTVAILKVAVVACLAFAFFGNFVLHWILGILF